jgi:hypothetical protein
MIINKYSILQREFPGFGFRRKNRNIASNEEAFMAILISLHLTGLEMTREQMVCFNAVTGRSLILSKLPPAVFAKSYEKLMEIVQNKGRLYLLQTGAHALNEQYKENVFALACDVVYTHFIDNNASEDLLGLLKTYLKMNNATAIGIMRVIAMKNSL